MRGMWRDIRAAWPRERRFTWRGWVLLAVLGCLTLVVVLGWQPVYWMQVFANWSGLDERYQFTVYVLALSWHVLPVAQISLLSLPAIILPLGIRRPAVSWWWYIVVIAALFLTGAGYNTLFMTLNASTTLPIFVMDVMSRVAIAALWGTLLGFLLRSWWAVVFVPALTVAISFGPTMIGSALGGTGVLPTLFLAFRWGFTIEPLLFQALLTGGLCLLAFRSWRAPFPAYLCRFCLYDRRGLKSAECPECGMVPQPAGSTSEAVTLPAS